jgi:glycosyltransferase involved in cell wall biosynthesis
MNILILCTKPPWPARDGGSIVTLNLATGLVESGCQVTFLAMNTPKHSIPTGEIPASLHDKLRIRVVDVNTDISPVALFINLLFSSYPYNAQRFISSKFKQELAICLKQNQFDLIQLEGPYLSRYLPLIRKLSNAKISMRAHNLEHLIWKQIARHEKNNARRRYLTNLAGRIRRLETDLLDRVDLLVPISRTDENDFLDMGARIPVLVCPAGLDISRYPENEQLDEIKLFYIGALDWGPNLQGLDWFFEEVWPGILEKWPGLKIALAGRNPAYYTSRRTLPANVSLKGEVEDSIGFYTQYNVMIVPLLSGSGIRVKILEAMAMGKTVISTSIGAAGLDAIGGEHLFIADTAQQFIHILQLIKDQPQLLKATGEKARRFVIENFDNLAITKKLNSFYKEHLR